MGALIVIFALCVAYVCCRYMVYFVPVHSVDCGFYVNEETRFKNLHFPKEVIKDITAYNIVEIYGQDLNIYNVHDKDICLFESFFDFNNLTNSDLILLQDRAGKYYVRRFLRTIDGLNIDVEYVDHNTNKLTTDTFPYFMYVGRLAYIRRKNNLITI